MMMLSNYRLRHKAKWTHLETACGFSNQYFVEYFVY